jgi:hypothetical protein
VVWTSMPVAAVNEHCDPCRPKNEVRSTPHARKRLRGDPVPEPCGVYEGPQCQFRRCIPVSVAEHAFSVSRRGRPRAVRGPPWFRCFLFHLRLRVFGGSVGRGLRCEPVGCCA